MNVPRKLARAREAAGLSQRELAKKLDVSPSTVAGWEDESGSKKAHGIRKDRLAEVAKILKLDVMELLG